MVLSSSAYAGQSLSFVVGRHRVRIEAPRYCHSPSCLSVSIPEIRETLDRYDNAGAPAAVAAKPLAPAPQASRHAPARLQQNLPSNARLRADGNAACRTRRCGDPEHSRAGPVEYSAAQATTDATGATFNSSRQPMRRGPRRTPLPGFQGSCARRTMHPRKRRSAIGRPKARGSVRIEQCGRALCGHVLNRSSSDNGEMVLINMKPKDGGAVVRQHL